MAEVEGSGEVGAVEKFIDNIWLLLGIGVVVPTLIFTVWGIYEIMTLPYLPLVK